MFREKGFRKRLKERKLNEKEIDFAVNAAREFLEYLEKKKVPLKAAGLNELKEYLSFLIDGGRNSMDRLLAIARYCYFAKKNDYYVYFTSILNGRDILPLIGKKLVDVAGEETQRRIFDSFELPPLGSPPDDYPKLTKMIVDRLEAELPAATCREVLTGNSTVTPNLKVSLIQINCEPESINRTKTHVTYTITALSEKGNQYINSFSSEYYRKWLTHWEKAINHYLQSGHPLQHH